MGKQLLSGCQDWNSCLPGFPQGLREGRTQLGASGVECVPGRGTLLTPPSLCAMRLPQG